jgi:chitinase
LLVLKMSLSFLLHIYKYRMHRQVGDYMTLIILFISIAGSGAYNYFVPIINASMDLIDFVQPQFYNNFYVNYGNAGTAESLIENYLGWINQYPTYQIPNFKGVPPEKLVMGVPASTNAANPAFYVNGTEIRRAIRCTKQTNKQS